MGKKEYQDKSLEQKMCNRKRKIKKAINIVLVDGKTRRMMEKHYNKKVW